MSYTEYSKELEAFIAKQRQLLELDKERIQRIKQEDPHTQHTPSRAEELQKDDHSLEEIASDNCPANDKLSKEKVNSQLSKKTATVPEVEAGPSGKAPRERNVPSASSIDSWTNMDHRARNVVAAPTTPTDTAPSPPPATVPSAARAKQMSPQQDEMEQWVSDTFFSYFPSFNKKQKEKKTVLSRTRQQEYQEYLKNIPEVTTKHQQYMQKYGTGKSPGGTEATNEKGTGNAPTSPPAAAGTGPGGGAGPGGATGQPQVRFGKSLVAEGNSNYRKGSPREKLIQDLAHTDLPTILNTDTIDRRNRMLADEESRRKLEYQKELIKQIEEKRKEVERLREKEKLEEEMLTSRLEQQLKTMQLEEQLEHERLRSEKIRIANEQNHIRRLQLLANLENDHKVFNPYDGQRKAFSENGGKAAAAAASSETKPTVPQPNGGAFSSGDERTKAAYQRYISNSATQQQEKQQPTTHLHPFVSVAPAVSTNALALSTEQEDYESSSETTADTSVMVGGGGGGGAMDDHRFQYCKSCRADGDRSRLPLQPALGKHSKRRQHCAKCKRPEAYNGGKRGEDANSRCIRCERTMKRAMNGTKGASLCAVCTLSTEADQQNKNFLYHPKKQQYHHTERRHHRAPLETDDDDVQVHRAVATSTTATVSPSQKNPFKVIDIQYHESDNEHGDLDVLNPVIVRNNYRKPPFSLNIDKDSLFHPSKKPPEPVFTVNIRNGEVFVDNKLRSGGAGGPSRYAPPDSPPLSDGDGETSSATVGDDLMDDRIAKYVRHYNTLWMKRGNGRKGNSNGQQHNDYHHHYHSSHHHQHHHNHREQEQHSNDRAKGNKTGQLLPSLSPPKVYVSDRPDNLKSDALKLMEKKWEVPAVERTKVNEKGSTRVLTQLGAIRKQLQLEQLQMDAGPSGYSKNY